MVKYYYLILFLLLLGKNNSTEVKCDNHNTNDENECFDLIDEDLKQDGYSCCYVTGQYSGANKFNYCYSLKDEEINDYIEELEDSGSTGVKVNCNNSYITFSLFLLSFIIALF